MSRRTGESAIFRPVSICINACLKWASYEMPLPDPRSGFILGDLVARLTPMLNITERIKNLTVE